MFSAQEARENTRYPRSQLMKEIEKKIIEESSLGHREVRIAINTKKYNLYSIEKQLRVYGYVPEVRNPYRKEVFLYIHW